MIEKADDNTSKQYGNTKNLEARIDFISAYRSGPSIWNTFWTMYISLGLSSREGNVLEIGAGTGNFWLEAPEEAIEKLSKIGKTIYITDLNQAMLAKLNDAKNSIVSTKKIPQETIKIEKIDARKMEEFKNMEFGFILAQFMLYAVPDESADTNEKKEDQIKSAVREASRSLRSDGVFVATTMDENIHMKELYALMREIEPRYPQKPDAILSFCKGNAEKILSTFFKQVVVHEFPSKLVVTKKHPIHKTLDGVESTINYVKSLPITKKINPSEQFYVELGKRLEALFQNNGNFEIGRNDIAYFCTDPIPSPSPAI